VQIEGPVRHGKKACKKDFYRQEEIGDYSRGGVVNGAPVLFSGLRTEPFLCSPPEAERVFPNRPVKRV
jgi:hypothetical protein